MAGPRIYDLKIATIFVIRASIVVGDSLGHNRNGSGVMKVCVVWQPIKRGHISMLHGGIIAPEWGV